MPHTILLAKVFGVFLLIIGMVVLMRWRELEANAPTFTREHSLRVTTSAMRLLAGLFLVMLHNDWSSPPAAVISLFGWMLIAVSIVYLALPNSIERLINRVSAPRLYVVGGICAIVLGIYLTVHGFHPT